MEKKEQFIDVGSISDKRLEEIYKDSSIMLRKMKRDPMFRKVYSDVNFYELMERISEIQETRKQLEYLGWE